MEDSLQEIFSRLYDPVEFPKPARFDINACASDGDNALHYVVRLRDRSAAEALIDAGIDVNKAGDLGYTPFHVACMQGDLEMIRLLAARGADPFALSEGESPFTSARIAGHDEVCDFLGALMDEARSRDPQVWLRARIKQLKRELERLEAKLNDGAH